ncbi:MAG: hypothetical protein QXP80_04130 [Zestosphaera sp.]
MRGLRYVNNGEVVGGDYVTVDELVYRGELVEVLDSVLKAY